MLPFIRVADIQLGPLPIHTFGLLVATAVILGTSLTLRRARERGLDVETLNSFITWMLVSGFIVAHLFNDLFYEWPKVKEDPLRLLRIWESISSFGGFLGGFIGVLLWKYFRAEQWVHLGMGFNLYKFKLRKKALPVFPLCDLILSVFPVAWIFGRLGCTTAHDHIGAVAPPGTPIAVAAPYEDFRMLMSQYKGSPWIKFEYGNFPRYDLGLLELLFTIGLSLFLVLTWRRKLPTGSYVAVTCLAYAPVRFVMDSLRLVENDVRHYGFTPAQWMCIALFAAGAIAAYVAYRNHKSGNDPLEVFRLSDQERREAARQGA
jgi:phosphatidylglycerol:prolipoprotein diacylglycerol transferase